MAAQKLKKYPKKPKATASLAVHENWLKKVKEVDKINNQIKADKKKKETIRKKIAGIRQA